MTICIAALATLPSGGPAIVCVADKMLSLGDTLNPLQHDSDVTKLAKLPNGQVGMIAGSIANCHTILSAISNDASLGKDKDKSINSVSEIYKNIFSDRQYVEILHQRAIPKELYERTLSSGQLNSAMDELYQKMENFSIDADVMLCGFNLSGDPHIICASSPGVAFDIAAEGSHAIGIACNVAKVRLLWSGTKRTHLLGRVLFDAFDAKANAETSAGVGFKWDAWVVCPEKVALVPKDAKDLIERAWDNHNRSPFEAWNSDEYLDPPEDGWETSVLAFSPDKWEAV